MAAWCPCFQISTAAQPLLKQDGTETSNGESVDTIPMQHYGSAEEDHGEPEDKRTQIEPFKWKDFIVGHILLVSVLVMMMITVISSQIATAKSNIFQLNSIKYTVQTAAAFCFICVKKYSFRIGKEHFIYFAFLVLADFSNCNSFYYTTTILPAGNLYGSYVAFFIIIALLVDLVRKTVSRWSMLTGIIACGGVALLLQPWHMKSEATDVIPCDFMDNVTIRSNWYALKFDYATSFNTSQLNTTQSNNVSLTYSTTHSSWIIFNPLILGSALTFIAALMEVIMGNVYIKLCNYYNIFTLLFWNGFINIFVSILVTVIWKSQTGNDYSLPSGTFCLLFTLAFALTSGFLNISIYATYSYMPVSKVAVAWPLVTLALYACQRTFLKMFYPGYGNLCEIFGIILISVGSVMSPIITLITEYHSLK